MNLCELCVIGVVLWCVVFEKYVGFFEVFEQFRFIIKFFLMYVGFEFQIYIELDVLDEVLEMGGIKGCDVENVVRLVFVFGYLEFLFE